MNGIPLPKTSKAVEAFTDLDETNIMDIDELQAFMNLHGFSDIGLGKFLGVTVQAVRLWKRGQRDMSLTTTKLIRLFVKYPQLMQEF